MNLVEEVRAAEARIRDHVRRTPVERSPWLAGAGGGRVWLKLENLQRTGSFKLRGAMNRLLSLSPEERRRGVVAASSGNHGAAVALGMSELGLPGVIFVPEAADRGKVEAIQGLGAEVRSVPGDPLQSEIEARRHAESSGAVYLSPYNDPLVVAGQGTVGLELAQQVEHLDALLVAVGGGGLASGAGGFLKALLPGLEVVACSPRNSAVMHASLEAGRIVERESEPTLSDGTAGGVEPDALTFDLCRRTIDRFVLVSEEEIAAAMRLVIGRHHTLIEGAAAVPVAALLSEPERYRERSVAVILCGANVSPAVLHRVLDPFAERPT